jgi:hypothetical protein
MRFVLAATLTTTTAALVLPMRPVAAESFEPGARFLMGEGTGAMGGLARHIVRGIAREFAVDASRVPLELCDPNRLLELYHQTGGRLPPHMVLFGFEHQGHIYASDALGHVDERTLAHETLHAVSHRFRDGALARGYRSLMEGVTEHLASRISPEPARTRSKLHWSNSGRAYPQQRAFAGALEELVGSEVLEDAFFGDGLPVLERAVDERLGAAAFRRAAALLERGRFGEAVAVLQGPPVSARPAQARAGRSGRH